MFLKRIQEKIEKIAKEIEDDNIEVPDGLTELVAGRLADDAGASWDRIVWDIADEA